MAQQTIGIGTTANDGTGDDPRTAGGKINANFTELYTHANTTSGNPHSVSASDVGLGNVDNTSDADKPVSTAQQTALDLKADDADLTSHTGNTSNPHSVTATQVGLGNCDNTADADKPVSTATQAALNNKLDLTETITAGATFDFSGSGETLGYLYDDSGTTKVGKAVSSTTSTSQGTELVLVREDVTAGNPATVYKPGAVVADSTATDGGAYVGTTAAVLATSADTTAGNTARQVGYFRNGYLFFFPDPVGDVVESATSYLQNVSEDTTPQLGGNLDVNGQSIVSVSNGNIVLSPDGTGEARVGANRILTVGDEGTGNGLDADTLDGNEASALLSRSNHTGTQTLSTISDAGTSAALDVPAIGDAASGEVVKGDDTRLTDARDPTAHASEHTDGTDDIQSATNAQKGLATAAHITAIEANTAKTGLNASGDNTVQDIEVTGEAYADGEVDDGDSSAADTINWTTGNFHKSTATGNCTYTFTAPSGPTTLILKLVNGGAHTLTWPATVYWPGGTEPSWTTSGTDIVSFYYDGTNYYGAAVLDLS